MPAGALDFNTIERGTGFHSLKATHHSIPLEIPVAASR